MADFKIQVPANSGTLQLGSGTVSDDNVILPSATNGLSPIDADKVQQCIKVGTQFDLPIGGTPVTREEWVFTASGAARIRGFHCQLADSGTSTSIAFDCKVNGSSILSSAVTYVHGDGDRAVKDGTISSAAMTAGQMLSISMTVTSATGAAGPCAWVIIEENAQT